jgi:glutamyl-tRNA reductase
MRVWLAGVSHHRAPVEVREHAALSLQQAGELARTLAGADGEAVCLSTCNRTEVYLAAPDDRIDLGPEVQPYVYRLSDEAAAVHLFRVAAGLDSMVPGEGEILGQVRAAYEAGVSGPLLDRLFRQALHVGKKVRTQTAIAESPASVSSAAAALAQQVFGELDGREILVIGAGTVSEQAARSLLARGARIAWVANRSVDRAAELAERFGGQALPLDGVQDELRRADVVVSSTSAPGFVLTREHVERALRGRKGRPLFLIDLAVPRDLEPSIHELDGCYLYDIDDLQAVVAETMLARRAEAERAEALVLEEAEVFRAWQASLDVVPAIASLRARAEEIREGELEKARGRLSERELKAVESVTSSMLNKLLHLPTVRMKEAAAASDGLVYADAVRHLFGLGEEER